MEHEFQKGASITVIISLYEKYNNKMENRMDNLKAKKRDSKLIADEHDEAVLLALHRFGWLPTRDISSYIWPTHQGTTCAKRALARLRKAGDIVQNSSKQRAPDGAVISVLSKAGARRLLNARGVHATSGERLLNGFKSTYRHRCLSNRFVIWWLATDSGTNRTINTEYDITSRRSILDIQNDAHDGKIADGFLIEDAEQDWLSLERRIALSKGHKWKPVRWATWVEVENAHKNKTEQRKMASALARMTGLYSRKYPTTRDDVVIHSAIVVCPEPAHEHRLALYLLNAAYAPDADHLYTYDIFEGVSIWRPSRERVTVGAFIKAHPTLSARKEILDKQRRERSIEKQKRR